MISPRELMGKLQLQSGDKLWLINAPREIAEELAAGAEVEMVHEEDDKDGIIAFFDSAAELETLAPRILNQLPSEGALWIAGAEDNRDALTQAGWRPAEEIDIGVGRPLQRFKRS